MDQAHLIPPSHQEPPYASRDEQTPSHQQPPHASREEQQQKSTLTPNDHLIPHPNEQTPSPQDHHLEPDERENDDGRDGPGNGPDHERLRGRQQQPSPWPGRTDTWRMCVVL